MRKGISILVGAAFLAGCGTSGTTPSAHTVVLASYKDPQYGFSFKYPATWKIPKSGGSVSNIAGVSTYVLPITVPNNSAQISITMDKDVAPFPPFQNGKTAPDPNGPTHTFQYFHAHVAGWPAMDIRRFTGKQITERDTIANTTTRSYDIRALTISPPFSPDVMSGYEKIVSTLKLPFS